MAWTALVLALLVPARAVALCCVEAPSQRGPGAESHGVGHHAPDPTSARGVELAADTGVPDCESLVAPAVRERGPADGGPTHLPPDVGSSAFAADPPPTAFRGPLTPAPGPLRPPRVPLRV